MPARLAAPFLLLLLLPYPAHAKSYHLDRIAVAAEVRQDGSMRIQETREVVFRGTFHAFDRAIPLPPGTQMRSLAVSEGGVPYREDPSEAPGTYHVGMRGHEVLVSWGYSATDETKTFVLDYTISGAVGKHSDVAELYWQFIEPKHDWESRTSSVTVTLPGAVPLTDIKAWAHGPLWGDIAITDGRVTFTCDPLPANEMLEGRILFPTEVIASSPRQDAATILPVVLAEEDRWVREANRQRVKAKSRLLMIWTLPALMVSAAVATWFFLYLRYGREYEEANPIQYLREAPNDWTPNQVAFVWRWGEVSANDMTATLMDLVRRGALKLIVTTETRPRLGGLLGETTEQEYVIERVRDYDGDLSDSERYLISQILFHDIQGDMVSLDTFQQKARGAPSASRRRFKTWQKLAKREAKRMKVVDSASKKAMGVSFTIAFLLFVGSIVLGAILQSPTFFASGVVGFALIPASFAIQRRTREAAEALHRWQAFRRYLTDFSQLREYPPPAVTLWEDYLVYAITLGVADRVIEQFKELYPQVAATTTAATFPHWVTSGGTPLSGMDSIGSVLSSFSTTLATATSSFSSSSGSGGGFSGGGGGGGGGGSSGAR
jgi:uncharacterized membrane protein